jgi:hypothetical protein
MADREMAAGIGPGDNVVQEVMESFGYCWIPRLLMAAQTSAKKVSSHLLKQYAVEGGDFLCGIVTGDEN